MGKYYSNGKLLLTGEYFILEGAEGLALPTTYGQSLKVEPNNSNVLNWESFDENNNCWLHCVFELPKIRLVEANFNAYEDGGNDTLAETLARILSEVKLLNPQFLHASTGVNVKTQLTFPRNWGLGTSSTLINNIALWAGVNPYLLLSKTFGGSGYDIACAQHNSPIIFSKKNEIAKVKPVTFNPEFKDQLYFVHLNKKQNSRLGIQNFNTNKHNVTTEIETISILTTEILNCKTISEFNTLIKEHESLVSKIIKNKPVQEMLFPDYFGQTKSLGAWGGDFILATGNESTPNYFKQKGFFTVIPFSKMIL